MKYFVGTPKDCHRVIKVFGDTNTTNVKIGTIKWSWLDNTGSSHYIIIPNRYVIPSGGFFLMRTQHWARNQVGNNHKTRCLGEENTFDRVVLFWNRRKSQLTVPLEK